MMRSHSSINTLFYSNTKSQYHIPNFYARLLHNNILLATITFKKNNSITYYPNQKSIKLIEDTIIDKAKRFFFQKLLHVNLKEVQKNYTIMYNNKNIASIKYNILDNSIKYKSRKSYIWQIEKLIDYPMSNTIPDNIIDLFAAFEIKESDYNNYRKTPQPLNRLLSTASI